MRLPISIRLLLPAAVILPLLMTAAAGWLSWRQSWREAELETVHAAEASADYARRIFDGLVLRIERAKDALTGLSDEQISNREPDLHEMLRRAAIAGPREDGQREPYIFVYDRNAYPLVSGNLLPVPRGQSFTQREFNQVLRDPASPSLHVSPVYVESRTGEAFFAISGRRDRTGNGLLANAYDGVIGASIYVSEAETALRRMAPARQGDVLSLIRVDGAVLARSIPVPSGTRLGGSSPLLRAMQSGQPSTLVVARSSLDGEERIAAYRHVAGYPVYASAARPRAAIVQRWTAAMLPLLATGGVATLVMAVLALMIRHRQHDLAEANAALEHRVEQRTTELAESAARLRRVQHIGRVGGFEIDLRSGENFRSPEYMELQGRAAVARMEQHADWVVRLHPEDRERAERRFLASVADDATDTGYEQEYRVLTPTGETRWIAARAEIERDGEGRLLRMVGAHVDVTALKAAQAALLAGEARLRAALHGARLGTWERHLPTASGSWDTRAAEIYGGLTPERCSPDLAEWRERVHPDDRAVRTASIEGAVAAGGPDSYDVEFQFRRDDGGWNRISVHGTVVERDPVTGRGVRLAGVVQDLTQRHAAEMALRASEERLRLAQEAGSVGSWEVDLDTGRSSVSDALLLLYGVLPGATFGYEDWIARVHPDDRERVDLQTRAARWTAPTYFNEFRIIRADTGMVRWLQVRSRRAPARDGSGMRVIGVDIDMTELRGAQEALRLSEERARLAVQGARLGTWEINIPAGLCEGSSRLLAMLGESPHEQRLIRTSEWFGRVHPDDEALVRGIVEAALPAGGEAEFGFECRIRSYNGDWRWMAIFGAVVARDPASGAALRAAGVMQDVTDRKRDEERQQLLMREVDHRAKNALAVVQAAVRLTPRLDAEAYARAVEGRILALARAHVLLAEGNWNGADMGGVARTELAPFLLAPDDSVATPRIELDGPAIHLSPAVAQGIALALHELATNATKYGALSVPGGVVQLSWTVDHLKGAIRLQWSEQGGPLVASPPTRRGFGSRVVEGTIGSQLGGSVERRWEANGLICTMHVPTRPNITSNSSIAALAAQ